MKLKTLKQGQGARERETVRRAMLERVERIGAALILCGQACKQSPAMAGAALAVLIRANDRAAIPDAEAIARLCDAAARRFARKVESEGGRIIEPSQLEEIAAIYRAEVIRTYAAWPIIPETDSDGYAPALWAREPIGEARFFAPNGCAPLRYAMRRASSRARSFLWGRGAEECTFTPVPAEHGEREVGPQLAAAFQAGESGVRSAWAMVNDAGRGVSARTLADMRRRYWDDRLRLAVYWARRGGKQWVSTLERGLRLLGAVHQSMSGRGCSGLLSLGYGIGEETRRADRDKLHKAVSALRAEINGGEHEITANPGSVGNTLAFLELVSDTPVFVRRGEGRKALANREAIARLRARLIALASGAAVEAPAMPDHSEAAARRVARRKAWLERHGLRGVPVFLPSGGISRPNLSRYASRLVARSGAADAGAE
jgi:hypothetical protein